MRTSIHIGALRFYAHHGVLPQEQKVGNYFKVETILYTDFSRASRYGRTDRYTQLRRSLSNHF